ncbi:hypothetical protein F2S72_09120 [Pseudomonas syringae pv. actinidiae]|nr:hypothetical protein [Pseudomonas syringae pv. actinidiae]
MSSKQETISHYPSWETPAHDLDFACAAMVIRIRNSLQSGCVFEYEVGHGMSPFQTRLVDLLQKMPMRQGTVMELAYRLKSNAAAVSSSSRALEKLGKVRLWRHGDDQWAVLCVALSRKPAEISLISKP